MNIDYSKLIRREELAANKLSDLKRTIADVRYSAETAPVTINGMMFYTDRDTRAMISQALMLMEDGETIKWKLCSGEFINLTKYQFVQVAKGLLHYVQDCFNRESTLLDAVADGSFTPEMLDSGWPDVTIQVNP